MSLPVQIGNYRIERNLGNGSFGKVKCKLLLNKPTFFGQNFKSNKKLQNSRTERLF